MTELKFIEVAKVKDGMFMNPQQHIERMIRTTLNFFTEQLIVQLKDDMIPVDLRKGLVKCRIVYSNKIISIGFESYSMKIIKSLKLIEDNTINYSYKYLNRDLINDLLALRNGCDDILIVKNSKVTDTSFTNVVFKDCRGCLFTPTSTLLAGTKRQSLLNAGFIVEKDISVKDISSYLGLYLINAMIDIEDDIFLSVDSIR